MAESLPPPAYDPIPDYLTLSVSMKLQTIAQCGDIPFIDLDTANLHETVEKMADGHD